MIQSTPPTDNAALMIAAIGSVTSVLLAGISAYVSIQNNRVATQTKQITERTERTVNGKTTALEVKIDALRTLNIAKDATIAAQKEPATLTPQTEEDSPS